MATQADFKYFNIDYFEEFLKEKKMNQCQVSEAIGKEKSYISDRKRVGTMQDAHIRLICALYGADYKKMTEKPVAEKVVEAASTTSDATISFILDNLQKLNARISALETGRQVSITDKEEIILLLQQMTKFGQCEEAQFKAKAKAYGFSSELMQFAIENQRCKREVTNGKVWLVRK